MELVEEEQTTTKGFIVLHSGAQVRSFHLEGTSSFHDFDNHLSWGWSAVGGAGAGLG